MSATPDGALIINAIPTGNELVEVWRGNMLVAYPVSAILGGEASTVTGVTPGGAVVCRGLPTGEEILECWANGSAKIAYRLSDISGVLSLVSGSFFTPRGVSVVNSAPTGNEIFTCWSGNTPIAFSISNLLQGGWILITGFWRDLGVWRDNDVWRD